MNYIPNLFLIAITLVIGIFSLTSGCSGMPAAPKADPPSITTKTNDTAAQINENKLTIAEKDHGYKNGDIFLKKYQNNKEVRHILLVEQATSEKSAGRLFLLAKDEKDNWVEQFHCKAVLGKNGIDKKQEGDGRTPSGDFGFLMAFGAKDNPGTLIPYTKLTDSMYLCGDKEYYNQFIDTSKIHHSCSNNSEHLIRYLPQYNYALFIDYNKENIYGKGSAIFLHCFGKYPYTLGCVSIAENDMIKILKTINKAARICIYSN